MYFIPLRERLSSIVFDPCVEIPSDVIDNLVKHLDDMKAIKDVYGIRKILSYRLWYTGATYLQQPR